MPRTSPSLLTISVTTRPQPPLRLTNRRNAVSVIPAIGATTNGESSVTDPMRIMTAASVRLDVRGVHFDAHRLANEIDRQNEPRAGAFPDQAPDHTFEGSAFD